MTATAQPKYHAGFEPMVPGFTYVPFVPGWELVVDNMSLVPVATAALGPVAGLGAALMAHVAHQVFVIAKQRWLYVSADSRNRGALRFYRKLGFGAVGRLPDLIRPGRAEILLRRGV